MIQSFADGTTEDLFNGRATKAARRIPKAIWPVVRRKLEYLNAARTLADVAAVPGNRLEALQGEHRWRYSIRVNQRSRITFRFETSASDVRCEDYHR